MNQTLPTDGFFDTKKSLFIRLRENAPAREVAWNEFYAQYAPIIGGFARRMGVRPHDVPDLVQDVLLGFFAVSPEFSYDPKRGSFRGYLKTCTWRIFQKKLGKQLRINGRALDDVDPADLSVEATWNDVWESEKLQNALENVRSRYLSRPDKARTFRAFEMYVLLERDPTDVARELGIEVESVHQAKTRLSKAVKAEFDKIDETTG